MSQTTTNLPKKILQELLDLFSKAIEEMNDKCLTLYKLKVDSKKIKEKFPEIDFKNLKRKVTFETKYLYELFITKIYDYLPKRIQICFNSFYSVLNFRRIINYLNDLIKTDINIIEDNTIKIFFYLLFLYFDDNFMNRSEKSKLKLLELDETFFKGTFIELTKKYSSDAPYKEAKEIKEFIDDSKIKIKKDIIALIDFTFQNINDFILENGNESDIIIKEIKRKANDILYELVKSNDELLSNELIQKIKEFYSNKEYLIFTNYISEKEGEGIEKNIDSQFLKNIEKNYEPFNFNNSEGDVSLENLNQENFIVTNSLFANTKHKKKLKQYINNKNLYYKRMYLSSLPEVLNWDLDDETIIFSLVDNDISHASPIEFEFVQIFKDRLKNLNQDKTIKIIEEILADDDFYDYYFSIMNSDIIRNFFTSILKLNESGTEFLLNSEKSEESECFDEIYKKFLLDFNNKKENFIEFKKLIIMKILTSGDRAYTISNIKKIVINPAQFFFGKFVKDNNDIKIILRGYLLVILLHETEHFFRLLDTNEKVFNNTPREKEGGRLFIKYLFDVESINHINLTQAKSILTLENWKDHKILKNIFSQQLEDIEENNTKNFIISNFPDAISFYSNKHIREKNKVINLKK